MYINSFFIAVNRSVPGEHCRNIRTSANAQHINSVRKVNIETLH